MSKLGDYPAFPSVDETERAWGMTYRQWLVGQVLPVALTEQFRILRSLPEYNYKNACQAAAALALMAADAAVKLLEGERSTQHSNG